MWINQAFFDWLYDMLPSFVLLYISAPYLVTSITVAELRFNGYLRIGSGTFFNGLHLVNPPTYQPPPAFGYAYVDTIEHTENYGTGGDVLNANGLKGSSNDGSFACIYGPNFNSGGQIVGYMDKVANGDIFIYGRSPGFTSTVQVWVSNNNNNDWRQVAEKPIMRLITHG